MLQTATAITPEPIGWWDREWISRWRRESTPVAWWIQFDDTHRPGFTDKTVSDYARIRP